MYSAAAVPVARTSSSGGRGALPLAAICCLGTLCFLIAATIVLALIPIYLPNKNSGTITRTTTSSTVGGGSTSPFTRWVRYRSTIVIPANQVSVVQNAAVTGPIVNLPAVATATGLNTAGTVSAGQAQETIARRKRSVLNRRQKRTVLVFFTFRVIPTFTSPCDTACQTTTLDNYLAPIRARTNIDDVRIIINSGAGQTDNLYDLVFDSVLTEAPVGFNSTSTLLSFTAAKSGAFNDPSTWSTLIVPYSTFTITIPAGITVTLALPVLEIDMTLCTISGTLIVGDPNTDDFTFNFPTTILILDGGILQVQSRLVTLDSLQDSVIFRFATGEILPANVVVTATITRNKRRQAQGSRTTIPSTRGPYTAANLPSRNGGGLLSFQQITHVGTAGGDFQNPSSYCGRRVAPTTSTCPSNCGVYVTPSCTLTTASLNGALTLPVTVVTVVVGATLTLGTPGSTAGFKFAVAVVIQISGALQFVASGGGILLPLASTFTLLPGAVFTATQVTFIQIYDPATGNSVGNPVILPVTLSGPFFVVSSANGTLTASIIGPGLNDYGSGTTTTVAGGPGTTTVPSTISTVSTSSTTSTSTSTSTTTAATAALG